MDVFIFGLFLFPFQKSNNNAVDLCSLSQLFLKKWFNKCIHNLDSPLGLSVLEVAFSLMSSGGYYRNGMRKEKGNCCGKCFAAFSKKEKRNFFFLFPVQK